MTATTNGAEKSPTGDEDQRNVFLELHDKRKETESPFFPPFLLGMMVAFLLMFIPTFSGFYWLCKDVPLVTSQPCPVVVKKAKKRGILNFLKKKKIAEGDLMIQLTPSPDSVDCACRFGWKMLGYSKEKGKRDSENDLCTPKVIQVNDWNQLEVSTKSVADPKLLESLRVAFTAERLKISSTQKGLIMRLAQRLKQSVPDLEERASKVQWGGSMGHDWLQPSRPTSAETTDLEALEGGHLLYSYLRIMQWPDNLFAKFPFKLCAKGCQSEVAIAHTLEFREKFMPWMISPGAIAENAKGMMYTRGFSPSQNNENGSHAIVWIRPKNRVKTDEVACTRAYVNTLERAVAGSLQRSNGRVGKFNVIVDGSGFSWGLLPSLNHLKGFVRILQDHYPDRLGIILLSELSSLGEFVLKMFLPLITKEVRDKIHILERDPVKRNLVLETAIGAENIPTWLGGKDTFEFDVDKYYSDDQNIFSDESAKMYLTTMPYHA